MALVTMNVFCMLSSYNKVNFQNHLCIFSLIYFKMEKGVIGFSGVGNSIQGDLITYQLLNTAQ